MSIDPNQVQQLFQQALAVADPDARAALVDRETAGNPVLRERLVQLLAAHEQPDGFGANIPSHDLPSTRAAPSADHPGTVIAGRHKLLENIGEGGMGSVWVAEQLHPVKRRVALKLIKAGMDSKQVLARFEAERQALALMDHPNIAKVLDGGMTDQGRPYFVMEYVKGIPFTQYCDQARLSLRERLKLFIPVCSAVQHAHHKGIVHRDLKPSNILICLYDGVPVPKVIDFGLAKALHQPLTEHSIYTAHGVMVGTPLYMSPEQAEQNNLDIDTRTDVYSLGVVLYELLTGSTPLERRDLQKAARDEILRLIREQDPLRPSMKLSGSDSLPSIAAQRGLDPRELCRSLSGDLDWIVMKSLEKERSRRYETCTGLARDIERYLSDEPVEATPPSRSYRLKKFIRKHRVKVLAATSIVAALLIGIVGTTWGLFRARIAEADATKSEQKATTALAQVTQERDAKTEALKSEAEQRALAEKQREAAEQNLINGILRPIGLTHAAELNDAELQSFLEWAAITDSRLKTSVLKHALASPETALRISRRADRVLQACIGTSLGRHETVVAMLSGLQDSAHPNPQQQFAATRLALELNIATPEAVLAAVGHLASLNRLVETSDAREFVKQLEPQITGMKTSPLILRLFVSLLDLSEIGIPEAVFSELGVKLDASQTEQALQAWVELIGKTDDAGALRAAGIGLTALAGKLDAAQTERPLQSLVELIRKTDNRNAHAQACISLSNLAGKLDAAQTERALQALVDLIWKTDESSALEAAGNGLTALASGAGSKGFRPLLEVLGNQQLRRDLDFGSEFPVKLLCRVMDEKTLVETLRHPGAIGKLRSCLLRRLEEVVFHEGRPVFSELEWQRPRDDERGTVNDAVKSEWQTRHDALPPRKFLAVHDATAWLAKNRPDIDLEAPWTPDQ
jgi:serine/threonine protein kinase